MAQYYARDIKVGPDGDLSVNSQGDLEMAASPESLKQALKFLVSTDYGEVDVVPSFGANLGSLVGSEDLNQVLDQVPLLIRDALARHGVAQNQDVTIHAIPIAEDQIYLRVETTGTFFDDEGQILDTTEVTLKFLFPYKVARITSLD